MSDLDNLIQELDEMGKYLSKENLGRSDDIYTNFVVINQKAINELQDKKKQQQYIKDRIQVLEVSYSNKKNDEYYNAKLFGGKKELENVLNKLESREEE